MASAYQTACLRRVRRSRYRWPAASLTDGLPVLADVRTAPPPVQVSSSVKSSLTVNLLLWKVLIQFIWILALSGALSSRSKAPSRGPLDLPPDEYTGPKLYVKPSEKQKSNRTIIINAISHCCLAGAVNTEKKNEVLEVRDLTC